MKKRITLVTLLCFLFVLCGCGASVSTSKTYTYQVDTGDTISIELDTSDGYDITSDLPFVITCDDETLSQGTFIEGEYYETYIELANSDSNVTILEESSKDGNQYIFWSYDDSEYNIVLLVEDSDTAVLIGNDVSEESARECFDRLTITLE